VPGDYDGDGKADFAVYRPGLGLWFILKSGTSFEMSAQFSLGVRDDVPVPADYDGDTRTDFAVWRPSNGTWYVVESSNGKTIARPWGVSTDIAINKPVGQ